MNKSAVLMALPVLVSTLITGCVSTGIKTSSGTTLKFAEIYSPEQMKGGKYVVIEINRITKQRSVVAISSERPAEIKANQEVLVFDKNLTSYGIAWANFNGVQYHVSTFPGTIKQGDRDPYYVCPGAKPSKSDGYTACSSDLTYQYLPYEVTVVYGKGQMSQAMYKQWEQRTANWVRPSDPRDLIEALGIVPMLEGKSAGTK